MPLDRADGHRAFRGDLPQGLVVVIVSHHDLPPQGGKVRDAFRQPRGRFAADDRFVGRDAAGGQFRRVLGTETRPAPLFAAVVIGQRVVCDRPYEFFAVFHTAAAERGVRPAQNLLREILGVLRAAAAFERKPQHRLHHFLNSFFGIGHTLFSAKISPIQTLPRRKGW